MSKHTPGPWYWSPHYKTTDGRATWSLVSGKDGYGILSCDGEENSPQGLNDEANARLIAAAPELLEAALHALNVAESWIHDQLDGMSAIDGALRELEPVRNAIAKATGEQA